MSTYVFKWKRHGFFQRYHTVEVIGHQYMQSQNKMVLYKKDGGVEEIVDWNHCSVILGTDWVAATKNKMEQEAGTAIPLTVKG